MNGTTFTAGAAWLLLSSLSVPAAWADSGIAVVETFSSEGCSSCPPADEMLTKLTEYADKSGLPIYTLEWHVDYWDYLGWKDPFGSPAATRRQYAYAKALPSSVYTPQAVINGRIVPDWAGDLGEVESLVRKALGTPVTSSVTLGVSATNDPGQMVLHVQSRGDTDHAAALALLVEDGLSATPNAGENNGRHLSHTHVVRQSVTLPSLSGDFAFSLPSGVDRTKAQIVVLLQDRQTLQVLAAGRASLPGPGVQKSSWRGRIIGPDGKGLADVAVQACSSSVCVPGATDSQGAFAFSELPAGSYSLTVGTQAHVVTVSLKAGENLVQNTVVSGNDSPKIVSRD